MSFNIFLTFKGHFCNFFVNYLYKYFSDFSSRFFLSSVLQFFFFSVIKKMFIVVIYVCVYSIYRGFPGGSVVKNPPASAGEAGDMGLIPGSGRSPG